MTGRELLEAIQAAKARGIFEGLYGPGTAETAQCRYASLIKGILDDAPQGFPEADFPETKDGLRVFTAAGRTELGGNHTDHNRGKVFAASIQMDAVAIVAPRSDKRVLFRSGGFPDVQVDLTDLSPRPEEKGTTEALVRGIAAELTRRGTAVGGFTANAASTVLPGSGLSSSAAVEVLFGRIFDNLYGGGKRASLEIAQIGQIAENSYFGKPSGLMDQTACASGGAVAIDFEDPAKPKVKGVNFDLESLGYALAVTDTRGSHADLTPDYAAIPGEMKAVAAFFGKQVLREVDPREVLAHAPEIRKAAGDRALLRAFHYFNENRKVDAMLAALEKAVSSSGPEKQAAFAAYLDLVNQSGDSSWELLQNVYSPKNPAVQGVSVALAVTRDFLAESASIGACRVHGGGFAGTIQSYIPLDRLGAYKAVMEGIFGEGSVTVLRIRPVGAAELYF
ncbi:galactokinase [Treponema primitia ZAS-2]|uniref:Galactokinase n=1 Tax=Treponema primitia (strain ATCC BAA-887 / DSM 12427 / ZAS-2) TaxID=545694 RepID=F5YNE8_TREPZ|nr:galactokinase family protein [Treponema primitia]AEF84945.1 galactokinase [Treponema primitia ZAS-2]